jgi:3-oxoacyl-(acyl-carrier-protein) synthase
MSRSVVITGIGVVLPGARTVEDIWAYQQADRSLISPLSDTLRGTIVDEDTIEGVLSPRLSKKLDSFTRYALVATQRAIEDADLNMAEVDKARCGVFVGNSFGGWRFTEVELRHLHQEGPRMVSPFQATSWFPAAPQGQITILHQIKGFSKTYMADRASSLVSVGSAAAMVAQRHLDVAIAGGTESTNTDFIKAALSPFGGYGADAPWPTSIPPEAYGFLVSEGAVFLILENRDRAEARGAAIYGEVRGCATRNAPCPPDHYAADPSSVARAMTAALAGATPDLVLPDACGTAEADGAEVAALAEVCPTAGTLAPKMKYGHTFGAEGALDIAHACLMFRKGRTLPAPYTPRAAATAPDRPEGPVRSVLINGRSLGGAVSSLFLSKGDD